MAELKPDVVYIKGVHSITGADTKQDIGFPQLELEKLFEDATIEDVGNAGYNADKKYVYRNGTTFEPIKDTYHFSCIKDGYYSLRNKSFTGYYTKDDTGYKYHAVPAISDNDWQKKLEFSNAIEDVDLYNIFISDNEADDSEIYLEDGEDYSYYTKNANNDYIKTARTAYDVLKDVQGIWDEPWICKPDIIVVGVDDDNDELYESINPWVSDASSGIAPEGYYFYVHKNNSNGVYKVGLYYLTFNNRGECIQTLNDYVGNTWLYRIPTDSGLAQAAQKAVYIKNNSTLVVVNETDSLAVQSINEDPTEKQAYIKQDTWLYPNFVAPINNDLCVPSTNEYKQYSAAEFTLYDQEGNCDNIEKVKSTQYTIFEKTARSINYQYKSTSRPLQLIFTDKDIPTVLSDCGLTPGNLGADISNYVHLTNIEYNN